RVELRSTRNYFVLTGLLARLYGSNSEPSAAEVRRDRSELHFALDANRQPLGIVGIPDGEPRVVVAEESAAIVHVRLDGIRVECPVGGSDARFLADARFDLVDVAVCVKREFVHLARRE